MVFGKQNVQFKKTTTYLNSETDMRNGKTQLVTKQNTWEKDDTVKKWLPNSSKIVDNEEW